MDPSSGEISKFPTRAELEAVQANRRAQGLKPLIELGQLPKPTCPRCYGRGTIGRNLRTGDVVACPCTRRRWRS